MYLKNFLHIHVLCIATIQTPLHDSTPLHSTPLSFLPHTPGSGPESRLLIFRACLARYQSEFSKLFGSKLGHLKKYQTVSNKLFQIKKFIYNSFPCPFDHLPVVSVNNAAIVTEYFLHVSVHVHSQCTFLFTFPVKRLNPPILLMFYRSMH